MIITVSINDQKKSFDTTKSTSNEDELRFRALEHAQKALSEHIYQKRSRKLLTVTVTTEEGVPPPDLGIHVSDIMDITDKFGG